MLIVKKYNMCHACHRYLASFAVGLACEVPGSIMAYDGPECCYECVCEKDHTTTCCRT